MKTRDLQARPNPVWAFLLRLDTRKPHGSRVRCVGGDGCARLMSTRAHSASKQITLRVWDWEDLRNVSTGPSQTPRSLTERSQGRKPELCVRGECPRAGAA